MNRFFPDHSPEKQAQVHISANVFYDADIGAEQIGLCAAYTSLCRFVEGTDLYIPPRNLGELQQILRNYSDHIVNSLGSQVRARPNYARAREISAKSLRSILSSPENVEYLLGLHSSPEEVEGSTASNSANHHDHSESFEPSGAYARIKSN